MAGTTIRCCIVLAITEDAWLLVRVMRRRYCCARKSVVTTMVLAGYEEVVRGAFDLRALTCIERHPKTLGRLASQ